jgi:GAF domain-containing protein
MSEGLAARLGGIIENLEQPPRPIASASLAEVAGHVAKGFGVGPDEVAILILAEQGKSLKFLIPEKLQAVGTIPMTSTTALAARTVREKRAELVNNFTAARHASVFEGIPLGRQRGELIHKIMSAPIVAEGKVVGVVQISRKGRTPTDAGPDFTQKELRELTSITGVLGRFVKLCEES